MILFGDRPLAWCTFELLFSHGIVEGGWSERMATVLIVEDEAVLLVLAE